MIALISPDYWLFGATHRRLRISHRRRHGKTLQRLASAEQSQEMLLIYITLSFRTATVAPYSATVPAFANYVSYCRPRDYDIYYIISFCTTPFYAYRLIYIDYYRFPLCLYSIARHYYALHLGTYFRAWLRVLLPRCCSICEDYRISLDISWGTDWYASRSIHASSPALLSFQTSSHISRLQVCVYSHQIF